MLHRPKAGTFSTGAQRNIMQLIEGSADKIGMRCFAVRCYFADSVDATHCNASRAPGQPCIIPGT